MTCGQEVAVKILRNVDNNSQQYQEFLQVGFVHFHVQLVKSVY